MKTRGHLRKMVGPHESPVQYQLPLDDKLVSLNAYIGESLSLHFSGEIHCIGCGNRTKKSYNQGYYYPCFISIAACDLCIMRPETCHYHLGTCMEPKWADTLHAGSLCLPCQFFRSQGGHHPRFTNTDPLDRSGCKPGPADIPCK